VFDLAGGFLESSLHFGSPSAVDTHAGAAVSLTVTFRYQGAIQEGASVSVHLPSFGNIY